VAAKPALPALTGLRFVAAAIVVAYHARAIVPAFRAEPYLTGFGAGYTGVSLFFVLSGFVLAYNYLTPDGSRVTNVRDFLVARFARVYPVYLVGIAFAAPLFLRDLQKEGGMPVILRDAPKMTAATVALLQAWIPPYSCRLNCPGWSLSAEAFFYVLFPLIGVWLSRRSRRGLLTLATLCWVLACAFAALYILRDPDAVGTATAATDRFWIKLLKFNPLVRLPEFVIGVATGVLFLRAPGLLGRRAGALSVFALAVTAVLFASHQSLPYPLMHNGLLSLLFALLIFSLATGDGPIARLLSTKPLHVLGEASYALYLLHVAMLVYTIKALSLFGMTMDRTPALILLYLVLAQLLAIGVLRWIEEPARKAIRRRFQKQRAVVPEQINPANLSGTQG
jgi:peptidoglycan/LPS O-acetylase OafA/YrhL